MVAYKLLKLWEKVKMEKQCFETMEYARPSTWHLQICIGLRFLKGQACIMNHSVEFIDRAVI